MRVRDTFTSTESPLAKGISQSIILTVFTRFEQTSKGGGGGGKESESERERKRVRERGEYTQQTTHAHTKELTGQRKVQPNKTFKGRVLQMA